MPQTVKTSLEIHSLPCLQLSISCLEKLYLYDIKLLYIIKFQPGDEFEIVPNSQFVVSRTARKDGSSDYYVDGKKKTFKEVGTLLRQSGIDLDHNRFLILQVS